MCRFVWILLLVIVLASSWTSNALGTTRPPDTHDYDGDDGGYDDDDYGEHEDAEIDPEVLISSILISPYLMERDGEDQMIHGQYEGVIPDLLQAICMTGHMSCDYEIQLVYDDSYGSRNLQGEWTGMLGEVARKDVDFAAAPININDERRTAVRFSEPFAGNSLTVVVNKADGIHSINDLLKKNITFGGVKGGTSLERLRNQPTQPYSAMWAAIESRADSKVQSTVKGIDRVLNGGYAFVVEESTARYYVNRHCRLDTIDKTFLPDDGYGFAFPMDSNKFLPGVNAAITQLKSQGKIEEIFKKWFSAKCGAVAPSSQKMALLVTLSAILFAL